jgi:hypothetical protein
MQAGLIVFDGEQEICASLEDAGRDLRLASHRIDGDQCSFEFKALEQQRDCGDLIGFDVGSLLAEDETLA